MDCTQYREELSARMDGEALRVRPGDLDAHVTSCPACTSWLRAAQQVTRLARLAPAAPLPDRTGEILAAVPGVRPRGRAVGLAVRLLLAAVALAQAALAYPDLVLGQDGMSSPLHVAHETGAWNAALAVAFLWTALRPRSASGLLPMVAAFVALVLVMSLTDLASESVHLERAATHLLTTLGLVLLAVLVRRRPNTDRPRIGGRRTGPDRHRVPGGGEPVQDGWAAESTRPASGASPRGNVA